MGIRVVYYRSYLVVGFLRVGALELNNANQLNTGS